MPERSEPVAEKLRILHHMTHGLGDAVQFTSVLRHLRKHRPDWHNHVVALLGKHTAYRNLADSYAHFGQPGHSDGRWYHTFRHGWFDYPGCHDRYPSTKVVRCLLHDLAIEPDPELLSYQIDVGEEARARVDRYLSGLPLADKAGFVVIHYEGNTSPREKNLCHATVAELCAWLIDKGYLPIILDWDRRSPLPDGKRVFCPPAGHELWNGWGTGDAETIAALIDRSACFVGIDSGPQKVAMSRSVPSVGVWTMLHPVNYADLCPHMIHMIPRESWKWIKGPRGIGWDYFRASYDYYEYDDLARELREVVANRLNIAPMRRNSMSRSHLLTARNFHVEYYEEHRRAGLDYLGHGEWQEQYGRWLVDVFGLAGQDVLDGGCAAGSIAYGFQKAGARAHGVDLNNHTIALGKLKFPVPLYVCDMVNLHLFGDNSFALVHTNQCAEHWRKELVPFILKEIMRVLKPGGIFWTALDTAELFARQERNGAEEDPTNGCIEALAWWEAKAAEAGFVNVRADWEPKLREHPLSFFRRYDWDWFCVKKPGRAARVWTQ